MSRYISGFSFMQGGPNLKKVTVTTSATPTFDLSLGNVFIFTFPAGNVTSSTFSNGSVGQAPIYVFLVQDSIGSRTFAWPSTIKIAGGSLTLTTTANAIDLITFCATTSTAIYEQSRSLDVK